MPPDVRTIFGVERDDIVVFAIRVDRDGDTVSDGYGAVSAAECSFPRDAEREVFILREGANVVQLEVRVGTTPVRPFLCTYARRQQGEGEVKQAGDGVGSRVGIDGSPDSVGKLLVDGVELAVDVGEAF